MRIKSRTLSPLCIVGYLCFMAIALDSRIADAVVLYVTEVNGKIWYSSGQVQAAQLSGTESGQTQKAPIVALTFVSEPKTADLPAADYKFEVIDRQAGNTDEVSANIPERPSRTMEVVSATAAASPKAAAVARIVTTRTPAPSAESLRSVISSTVPSRKTKPAPRANTQEPTGNESKSADFSDYSVLELLKSLPKNRIVLDRKLGRYVVRYDKDTKLVLTIRPGLQRILEASMSKYTMRVGVGIIQEPRSGAILAMATKDRTSMWGPDSKEFVKEKNWALQATFPAASLFKIVTAAAALTNGRVTPQSRITSWKKATMPVWEAFATSHNGVFGRLALMAGRKSMEAFTKKFGFNQPFYFDLPVTDSVAVLPKNKTKFGQAAAGLNRDFLISPVHVAAMVSSVVNGGKMMKPYLIDYILFKNEVVFRRRPFEINRVMEPEIAKQIYEMMYTTNTHGTGRRGFSGFGRCPELPELTGGKTGTLTGNNPNFWFTWYGGFTRTAGRELSVVTLCGQTRRGGTKATDVAAQISYDIFIHLNPPEEKQQTASNK